MNCLTDLFNNSVVSALIGAFSAFILVMFTDYIRSRRVRSEIIKLLQSNRELLIDKKSAIISFRDALKEDKITGDKLTPFTVEEINQLKLTSIKRFKVSEIAVLQSICFRMQILDEMINNAAIQSEVIRKEPDKISPSLVDYIYRLYNDIIPNFGMLDEMIENYLNKNYNNVIQKKYLKKDYE